MAPAVTSRSGRSNPAAATRTSSTALPISAPSGWRRWTPPASICRCLSLQYPGTEQCAEAEAIAVARESNDFLADAVKKNPKRFAGLAALPTAAPEKAAAELETQSSRRLQRRDHQRPQSRPLSRRQVLLADPRVRRKAQRADLSAPDAAAQGGDRGVLWRFCAGSELDVLRPRLGLAYRDGGPRHAHHPRRRVRSLSEAADRGRPSGRRPAVHAAAARPQHGAGADQTEASARRVSAPERSLHVCGLQFSRRRSSTCCSKSASSASCFRSIIRTARWRRRASFWRTCRSAPPIASRSPTAMPRNCLEYNNHAHHHA